MFPVWASILFWCFPSDGESQGDDDTKAPKTYELKEEKQCPFWIFLIMQGNTHKDQDQRQQEKL